MAYDLFQMRLNVKESPLNQGTKDQLYHHLHLLTDKIKLLST